jgi:apolipoprotein D and lipocalin family protein
MLVQRLLFILTQLNKQSTFLTPKTPRHWYNSLNEKFKYQHISGKSGHNILMFFADQPNSFKKTTPGICTMNYIRIHLIILFFVMANSTLKAQELQTVPFVDLNKYPGKWYEIASFPQRFQKGCHCTTAEYTLSDKGYVIVENRCRRDSVNGKASYIKGKAFVDKNSGNAKLKVQFFWPFKGKYWIIDLADDYSYAAVSHPNKKYLWILSRTPKMNDAVYQQIVVRLKTKGFDLSKLQTTIQC